MKMRLIVLFALASLAVVVLALFNRSLVQKYQMRSHGMLLEGPPSSASIICKKHNSDLGAAVAILQNGGDFNLRSVRAVYFMPGVFNVEMAEPLLSFPALSRLEIHGSVISDDSAELIQLCKSLETVTIDGCEISCDAAKVIASTESLGRCFFSDGTITQECIETIRSNRPTLVIGAW